MLLEFAECRHSSTDFGNEGDGDVGTGPRHVSEMANIAGMGVAKPVIVSQRSRRGDQQAAASTRQASATFHSLLEPRSIISYPKYSSGQIAILKAVRNLF